jgi:hypothetical protein
MPIPITITTIKTTTVTIRILLLGVIVFMIMMTACFRPLYTRQSSSALVCHAVFPLFSPSLFSATSTPRFTTRVSGDGRRLEERGSLIWAVLLE